MGSCVPESLSQEKTISPRDLQVESCFGEGRAPRVFV